MGGTARLAGFLSVHRTTSLDHLTQQLVDTIVAANPGYDAIGVVPRTDLERSCEDNILRVLELLALRIAGQAPDTEGPYFDAARATGTRRAEQGLPLDDVLRSFRMGGRLIWEDIVDQTDSAGLLEGNDLRLIGTELWQVVDETSAEVAVAYHAAARLRLRADEARRAALWEEIFSGRGSDPGFVHEAAQVLGVAPEAPIAVVAVGQPASGHALADCMADALLSSGIRISWQHRSGHDVGVLELPDGDLARTLEVLGRFRDVPIGLSSVLEGLAGAGQALREALLALRTVRPEQPGVVSYLECLPDALLLSAPEVARRLVDAWLGPVLDLPTREHSALLSTLQSWVDSGGSASRAAALIPCHRNTVVNRLRRVVEVTGRPLDEGPPSLELSLALRAWRLSTDNAELRR